VSKFSHYKKLTAMGREREGGGGEKWMG